MKNKCGGRMKYSINELTEYAITTHKQPEIEPLKAKE